MSDDKNKDPKAKSAASGSPSVGGSSAASGPSAAASGTAPGGAPQPKKPAPAKPSKEAMREADIFPADEEEDDADDVEDGPSAEALFNDENADEEEPLEVGLTATDTSERIILVVDEEGQRRNETVAIITQILPNAVIEVASDPEEALGMMEEGDFDTFVVNFLMPGYSSSPFVKAVANHPEHPLLIGFAADKMSDAVDPKKGLKIIPLKRLFDLDTSSSAENPEGAPGGAEPADD
jgi:hypothetical protein